MVPDGRFIAVVCNSATGSMQIFRFYGSADSTPSQVGSSISTGNTATCVSWSPDGRFLAVVAINSNTLRIYKFNGYSTPTQVDSNISTGAGPNWVTWSPDGRYIAVADQGGNTMQIFWRKLHCGPDDSSVFQLNFFWQLGAGRGL